MGRDIEIEEDPLVVDVTGDPTANERKVARQFLQKIDLITMGGRPIQATLRTDSIHIQIDTNRRR